ncbi:MAG: hypothetical protein ACKOTZ_01200 [Chloroflexota bacterium]
MSHQVTLNPGDVESATSTSGFADKVIESFGRAPSVRYPSKAGKRTEPVPAPRARWATGAARAIETTIHGVDIYVEAAMDPQALGAMLSAVAGPDWWLEFISTRGTLVYPTAGGRMDNVGWWRCRFIPVQGHPYSEAGYAALLQRVNAKVPWVQAFKLRGYGGKAGYTAPQGA